VAKRSSFRVPCPARISRNRFAMDGGNKDVARRKGMGEGTRIMSLRGTKAPMGQKKTSELRGSKNPAQNTCNEGEVDQGKGQTKQEASGVHSADGRRKGKCCQGKRCVWGG